LAEELRQPAGHDGEFFDEQVEFGGFAQCMPAEGEVGEHADGLGGGGGVLDGGSAGDAGHWRGHSSLVVGSVCQVSGVTP
jgi:hypothetical protein